MALTQPTKRQLFLVILWLCFAYAHGTGFILSGTPTGGIVTAGSGAYSYNVSNSTYTGSSGGVPCGLNGALVFNYQWAGLGTAPQYVVLAITAKATWGGSPGSGACSDGLNDPEIDGSSPAPGVPPTGGVSQGTHYKLVEVNGSTFQYSISPTAASKGSCSISVSISVSDITVDVAGPVLVGSDWRCFVGQQQTASLSVGSCTASGIQWNLGGATAIASEDFGAQYENNPVAQYGYGYQSHQYTELDESSYSQPILSFYRVDEDDMELITCSATLTAPDGPLGNVTCSTRVSVSMPDSTITSITGATEYLGGAASPTAISAGEPTATPGIKLTYTCMPDSSITDSEGYGHSGQVQLCRLNASVTGSDGVVTVKHQMTDYELDTSFPYNTNTDWVSGRLPGGASMDDSPNCFLLDDSVSVDVAYGFKNFVIFLPPPGFGTSGVIYVPIQKMEWQWYTSGSKSAVPPNAWSAPSGNPIAGASMPASYEDFEWQAGYQYSG